MDTGNEDCAAVASGVRKWSGVLESRLSFAKAPTTLADGDGRKDVKKLMETVLRSDFDAKDLQRYMRGDEDCLRLVLASWKNTLSEREVIKENLPSRKQCSTSGTSSHRKNFRSVLQKRMSVGRSGRLFCKSPDISSCMAHPSATESKRMEKKGAGSSNKVCEQRRGME